jgi:membrane protease YdiL (CAAX protease family)
MPASKDPSANPASLAPLPVLSIEPTAEPMAVLPIPETGRPKFCRVCGANWQLDWVDCLFCTQRLSHTPLEPLTIAPEWRSMKSALWLYFSLLFVCAIGVGFGRTSGGVELQLWVTAGITATTLIWCGASVKSVMPPLQKIAGPVWFALALGLSLVTYAIAMGVIHGLNSMTHTPEQTMSKPFLKAGYSWAAVVLFVCVQPALIEELAFRGVIFAAISKALSGSETILVSALMFMILHLSPARFPHTLALGIGAGFLRSRTKSLYPCMLMHFSHNFLCIAGEWLAR